MSSLPVFVGLDYHQNSVQVCVLDAEGKKLSNRSLPNDCGAIHRQITQFGPPKRIAVEACCGAADLAEELITDWRVPVELAHPGYVNRLKQSPDKTDFGDAQLLADLVRVNYLPQVWLAPRSTRELRRLVRHRGQLVARRKNTKLRIRGMLRENRLKCATARAWTKAWFTWLAEEAALNPSDRWIIEDHLEELVSLTGRIAAVEAKIGLRVKDDPIVAHLLKQAGIGLVTAVTLRSEIGRVERFGSAKQLSRFCGVTPRNASSGARQADAGLIRAGNPALRTVLIEAAHRLINSSKGPWAKLAERMLKKGKRKNIVVAAIANRWVRWLYHELKRCLSDDAASAQTNPKGAAPSAITTTST